MPTLIGSPTKIEAAGNKPKIIEEFIGHVNDVSFGLLALGLKKDDKIGLISGNRPEWNFIDLGMLQIGVVNVPLYLTLSSSEFKFILNDA